jgi:hypothetical protein
VSKASSRQRPARLGGVARRRVEARRRKRNRLAIGAVVGIVVVFAGTLVGLHVASRPTSARSTSSAAYLSVGTEAPNGTFTVFGGQTETVASLHGRPALIWLVTTWCSSCQVGTATMARHLAALASLGVKVIELENFADLGQSGPSIGAFGKALAGSAFLNPDWTFGEASPALTRLYNPKAYLDLYYLVNAKGRITYVNSSPGSTMPQLLSAAKALR